MKQLKDILEGILDKKNAKIVGKNILIIETEQFLKKNFNFILDCKYTFREELTKDGKLIVDCDGLVALKEINIDSFTNDSFVWGYVRRFDCSSYNGKKLNGCPEKCLTFECTSSQIETLDGITKDCDVFLLRSNVNLKSLIGLPDKCIVVECDYCNSLTDLTGAPKFVHEKFSCSFCDSLKSLKGAPEKMGTYLTMGMGVLGFRCISCKSLKTLDGAPEECVDFDCSDCRKLKSLKGAPKKCKSFICDNCKGIKDVTDCPECEKISCLNCNKIEDWTPIYDRCKKVTY